ncbi:MAG: bifunctional riboflavin kinase/FAD synthetase [Planctomycetota bacterium]|jgi:riboflavin kinase/FMN adenylyltransferase
MKTYFGFHNMPDFANRPVLTLGVFDGVHIGHCQIIEKTVDFAAMLKTESVVITFDTHPKGIVEKKPPKMITSLTHRLAMFENMGVNNVIVLTFHEDLAGLSAEEFFKDILINKFNMQLIVLGEDASFGRGKKGNADFLKERAAEYNFKVDRISHLKINDDVVSSTAIRSSVIHGDLELAGKMLGRPITVMGTIAAGSGIGRTLGYPTLNLDLHHELHPPKGVYISRTCVGETCWNSVTNIGNRPTVDAIDSGDVIIETHILHNNVGDLYGHTAEVSFLKKIRDEKKFADKEKLIEAIKKDVELTNAYFKEQ